MCRFVIAPEPLSGTMPVPHRWVGLGGRPMVDGQDKAHADNSAVVRRLVEETGITDDQAVGLILCLGVYNWASLLREARILKPSR